MQATSDTDDATVNRELDVTDSSLLQTLAYVGPGIFGGIAILGVGVLLYVVGSAVLDGDFARAIGVVVFAVLALFARRYFPAVLAGHGLVYAVVIDSMQVFNAAPIAVFILLAVPVIIIARSEPVVSRENVVISVCVFVAMALFFGLSTFTALPYSVLYGILFIAGVIAPMLVLQYGSSVVN